MKQILAFTVLFLSFQTLLAQSPGMDLTKRLDSLADYYRETLGFNGTILVSKKGQALINKGYGYQDRSRNVRNTKDGIYLIGSVTKQFTAELVLMLAKEGKLSLDDKLSKYFPDYPQADSVRLEHLLTHTSGIFDYTQDSAWQQSRLEEPISDQQIFSQFENKSLKFVPGSRFQYSNTNYKLLGLIIEKLTAKTYYENIRQRIFQPLGMSHSGFDFTHLKDGNKTVGYYRVRNDSFLVSIIVDSTQTNAAGGIYSTTGDMLKWHRALQEYRLLPKEWQEKAYLPFKDGYGYGWEIDSAEGKLTLAHSGHIHGYNSNFCRLPKDDVCIVVFTNLMKTGADPIVYTRDILRAMYDPGYVIPAVRKEVQLSEEISKRYEGVYALVEDTSLLFTFRVKDNQLFLRVTGQGEVPLIPQSETLFFTRVVDAQIEFKKNEEGEYDMVLHQNGQDLEGKRKL